jgi:hypothetical protein
MSTPKPHPLAALTTPDEDPAKLAELIITLAMELSPRTHLERRQVELIAHTDWEITRHRRRSAQLLETEAVRLGLNLAREEARRDQIARLRNPNLSPQEPPPPDRSGEFIAKAYANNFHFHAHHEASTERLEARRRQLLRDYYELKATRERASATDAEIVSE